MKKILCLTTVLVLFFSITCLAGQRQRVADVEPKDRNIAMGGLFLLLPTPQLGPTSLAEFSYDKIIGWTNDEVYFEDDFGRIVGASYNNGEYTVFDCDGCGQTLAIRGVGKYEVRCPDCGRWNIGISDWIYSSDVVFEHEWKILHDIF